MLKAAKACFANIVEVSGTIIPREENQVRPERMGLKVAEVMVDAGDSVTAGQVLARLTLPEGGQIAVQAPVGGVISASTASVGAMASGKGEALFSIIARGEFDLVGMVPTRDIQKLAVNQTARIKVIGAGEVDGKVRRLSTTVEPNSQLAQVFLGVTTNRRLLVNSSGRAQIKTGQSCGVSVPLTAILYGSAGTVVQVVRRARVETRRVETGLMSAGQVEITSGVPGRRHRGGARRRAAARRRSGAGGDGERGREVGRAERDPSVVPANAGTHTPRPSLCDKVLATALSSIDHAVWVPAFAGTTCVICVSRMYYVYILASRRTGPCISG